MISRDEIIALLREGFSQADVARHYGVTRQHINKILKTQPGPVFQRPVDKAHDRMPFVGLTSAHKTSPEYRKLLDHLKYVLSPNKVTPDMRERLERFYSELDRLESVIEFDPSVPPRPGSKGGGWIYTPRLKSDRDLIIRVNEHTNMTERDYTLWKMPAGEGL